MTADEALKAIKDEGYVVLRGALAPERVTALLTAMRALSEAQAGLQAADTPFLNRGHDDYVRAFTGDPLLMDILKGLLNDVWYRQIPSDQPNFILRSVIGRSSGKTTLPLHLDSFIPSSGETCFACQIALVLEDQTPERGCTVIVPGTHRSDRYADQEAMSRAEPLNAKAGDIVIWDSRLWHGALPNTTDASRWSLIATFVRWWIKQNYDVTGTLPQDIYEALTDDEKAVLGYCSMPPRDEHDRTDIKTGHEFLKPRVADYV